MTSSSTAAQQTTWCLFIFLVSGSSESVPSASPDESAEEIHAEAGDAVLLSCRCLRTGVITALKWRRTNMEDFVLFYREKRCYEQYQNVLFKNRVQMADPQMTNKNLSIILFNTTVNDTGTYLCDVGIGTRSLTLKVIHLKVTPPTAAPEEDSKDGGNKDGGNKHALIVALPVALLVGAALVALVALISIYIIRRHRGLVPLNQDDL